MGLKSSFINTGFRLCFWIMFAQMIMKIECRFWDPAKTKCRSPWWPTAGPIALCVCVHAQYNVRKVACARPPSLFSIKGDHWSPPRSHLHCMTFLMNRARNICTGCLYRSQIPLPYFPVLKAVYFVKLDLPFGTLSIYKIPPIFKTLGPFFLPDI